MKLASCWGADAETAVVCFGSHRSFRNTQTRVELVCILRKIELLHYLEDRMKYGKKTRIQ